MPCVGFEPTIPASERAKTVHVLERSDTVTGGSESCNSTITSDVMWSLLSLPRNVDCGKQISECVPYWISGKHGGKAYAINVNMALCKPGFNMDQYVIRIPRHLLAKVSHIELKDLSIGLCADGRSSCVEVG
jgi:hypothetical protein